MRISHGQRILGRNLAPLKMNSHRSNLDCAVVRKCLCGVDLGRLLETGSLQPLDSGCPPLEGKNGCVEVFLLPKACY